MVQASWEEAVGSGWRAWPSRSAERGGAVTVRCSDPVWAEELELMQERLLGRLEELLGDAAPKSLRFRVESVGE